MSTPEPILLVMPEGITEKEASIFREEAEKAGKLTGRVFVCLPHGFAFPTKRVVPELPPALEEAVMALPRIATALENIAKHLPRIT